ncbi:MAG: hypothetical protein RSD43_07350 [Anaerovoracaceae bacterium]
MFDLANYILMIKNELDSIFRLNSQELATLPKSHLQIVSNRKFSTTYEKTFDFEDQPVYKIHRKGIGKNPELIKSLVRSNYLKREQKEIARILRKLELISSYNLYFDPLKIIDGMPKSYKEFPIEYFLPNSAKTTQWEMEDYPINTNYPESLIYRTRKEHMVRSKSECTICNELFRHGIPYRYEAPVEVYGTIYHPDFTVMRKSDGKIFYWEHFGKADNTDEKYVHNSLKKINTFISSGQIVPWDNLICTYEYHIKYPELLDSIIENLLLI